MCGIFCSIVEREGDIKHIESHALGVCNDCLKRRGPDLSSSHTAEVHPGCNIYFVGHVLWMQGKEAVIQPFVDSDGNVLLWNGDIFSGLEVEKGASDTAVLSNSLRDCKSNEEILGVLCSIKGPWSLIYWNCQRKQLWFGRDVLGRHSLLWSWGGSATEQFVLSSVGRKDSDSCDGANGATAWNFTEVPAVGVFVLELNSECRSKELTVFPWKWKGRLLCCEDLQNQVSINIDADQTINSPIVCDFNMGLPTVDDLSVVNHFNKETLASAVLQSLSAAKYQSLHVEELLMVLKESVRTRVSMHPLLCKICIEKSNQVSNASCTHAKIAVLFSGGLDSTILALLADMFVPAHEAIDLLNVAFEQENKVILPQNRKQRRWMKGKVQEKLPSDYEVPDRITGRQSVEELRQLSPYRKWNFVEINITKSELVQKRQERIADLVYPLQTVLDDSLGCAVWFAARGIGCLSDLQEEYTSPARIVLVGMGADEQLGGYSRHRFCLANGGWEALASEIQHEVARISTRNLGRDNRVITDHGREARFPYLDENVVSFLNSLPVWKKAVPVPDLPPGVGEKLLLRLLAWQLGLRKVAAFPKRALQFGSRIAKLESSRERASDICKRL